MLSKNKTKFINSLKKKKKRNENALFLAEGEKIIQEILQSPMETELMCGTEKFLNSLTEEIKKNVKEIIAVDNKELSKISSLSTPNEVLAVVKKPKIRLNQSDLRNSLSLALDTINDPGNLGTIVRIADWFGIQDIFCSEDTVDIFNPKAVQSTMGAICRVNVHYLDIEELITELKQSGPYPVYGCFLEGKDIYKTNLTQNGCIILGSESHGISETVAKKVDNKLYIPNFSKNPQGSSESLNVSIATGIVCSEFRRRK